MDRKELLRLMPENASDMDGARRILELGFPTIEPVHRDMVQAMRVAESSVADAFSDYFAEVGGVAAPAISNGLSRENCWLRYRLLTRILPRWPDASLFDLRHLLTMIATQPDAHDNDIRSIELLAQRGLADISWLEQWVMFQQERLNQRNELLTRVSNMIARPR